MRVDIIVRMTFSVVLRPLALAGVVSAMMAGTAAAQTVVVRGVPAGSTVEVVQGAAVAAGTPDREGDASVTGSLADPGEHRVNIYVDICETVRRVHIVERDGVAAAPADGCTRSAVPGLFVVRPESTIVVNLTGAQPTVLLRQGSFDYRRVQRTGVEPAEGLIVFGTAGFTKLHNARAASCGDIAECPGEDSGFAFGGGMAFWFTPYAGLEASYVKPKRTLFEGAVNTSLFQSTQEPHVLMLVAKLGVPVGPVRIYGQGGATYHRATLVNSQDSVDDIEDRFELRTAGWGWTFGGGLEAWVSPSFAFYAEGGRAALKGGGVESGGEGELDERMTFVSAGLRIRLSR